MNFKNIPIEELAAIVSTKLNEHGIDCILEPVQNLCRYAFCAFFRMFNRSFLA